MKRLGGFLIMLVAIGLQGCIVKSLHPFFKESDVVFKKEFLGTWMDADGDKWIIMPYELKKNAYEMHWLGKGDKNVSFLVHMFQLNDELYLDVLPTSDGEEDRGGQTLFNLHLLPTHSIAKVGKLSTDQIEIKWFNEEWLKKLFVQNRIRISHETILDEESNDKNNKIYILTAGTDELQQFIVKYGHEDEAFDNNNTMWLRLKRII